MHMPVQMFQPLNFQKYLERAFFLDVEFIYVIHHHRLSTVVHYKSLFAPVEMHTTSRKKNIISEN